MKYLVVLVVVLGFACGSEEEDLGLQEIDIEDEFDDVYAMEEGRQATLDPALIIGNIISALGNLNLTDPNSIVGDILDALKITGASTASLGGLGAVAGVKTIFDVIVTGILGLIAFPVGIANTILSLVGLVVLIIFLIDGGDFGSLLGVARSLGSSWMMPELSNFNLIDNVYVPISNAISAAKEMYD